MDATVEQITSDLETAPTREHFDAVLRSAYAAGWSLQQLGDIAGVTREAIRLRLRRPVPAEMLVEYPSPHNVVARAERKRAAGLKRKRILGLKLNSPVMDIPVKRLNEIAALHQQVTLVRGWTPLDSPEREAIGPYGDLLWETIQGYRIPQGHLERVMGLGRMTLTVWLRNHGYLPQMPSQKSYKGVVIDHSKNGRGPRQKVNVPGGVCRNGHHLTEETLVANGSSGYMLCKICRAEYSREQYLARRAAA